MTVNRNKPHLVVVQEDSPYRDLTNGIRNAVNVEGYRIHCRTPVGGWSKVLDSLNDNISSLKRYNDMHLLLLMDFDNKFVSRMNRFQLVIAGKSYENRVFLLGVDNKEFENLKQTLGQSNIEHIGKMLVEECPQRQTNVWNNKHLNCNKPEIKRMRDAGVFEWLFC